jgi:glutamate 5-kinase
VSKGPASITNRAELASTHRIVVKVGSSSLTDLEGGLDPHRLGALVDVLGQQAAAGHEVLLVSSGAIAAGLAPLGLRRRPRDLATQQAAASVGQGLLLAQYTAAFARHRLTVGQVLLTAEDVIRRTHYANAQRTLYRLIGLGVVPVINENDTVATDEIRFGDNDRLAALVAHLVHADVLLLLSDVDALHDGPPSRGGTRRIGTVAGPGDLAQVRIRSTGGAGVGRGGMQTKVEAARIATTAGIATILTSADQAAQALAGQDVGTFFAPTGSRRATRLLWLAHATNPLGRLILDAGAVTAVVERRMSLLPAGILALDGDFGAGDPVDLCDENGSVVARGLVNYASKELPGLLGRSTRDLARELGSAYEREVVHRDDLVLMRR